VRPEERLVEAPDLAWNRIKGEANEKHSQALVNFAEEEEKRIAIELARNTLGNQIRASKAAADKLEAEARLAQTNELAGRLELLERCRQLGVIPLWDNAGRMVFSKSPKDLDWDGLEQHLLLGAEETPVFRGNDSAESNIKSTKDLI
jgi:hypothetical protein